MKMAWRSVNGKDQNKEKIVEGEEAEVSGKEVVEKEIKYDMRLKHLIPNFILQIMHIFIAGMACFYILVGAPQTVQYAGCSFSKIMGECVKNGGTSLFEKLSVVFTYYRVICMVLVCIIVFYFNTLAGTAAIGYQSLSHFKKIDNFARFLNFEGLFANFLLEFNFVSLLAVSLVYYSEYDFELNQIYVHPMLADSSTVFAIVATYFFLRLIYILWLKLVNSGWCGKSAYLSIPEYITKQPKNVQKSDFVYSNENIAQCSNVKLLKGLNIAQIVLIAIVVAFNYTVMIFFIVSNVSNDRIMVISAIALITFLNSIKYMLYISEVAHNLPFCIKNGLFHAILLLVEFSVVISFFDPAFFYLSTPGLGADALSGVFFILPLLLIAANIIVCLVARWGVGLPPAASSQTPEWLKPLTNAVLTTAICFLAHISLFIFVSGFTPKAGGDALKFAVRWCSGIAGNAAAREALSAIRYSHSFLVWFEMLFLFINVDNIAVFFCILFLLLFPRKLESSEKMAALFNVVVLYKAYTSFRSDGILDGLFERLTLGPVEIELSREALAAFTLVSAATEKCAVLFLVMLMAIEGNTKPTVDGKDARGAGEKQGKGELKKTANVSVGTLFTVLALFATVYLVFRAEEETWFVLKGKSFEGPRYQSGQLRKTAVRPISVSFDSDLSQAIADYIKSAKPINNLIPEVEFFHHLNDRRAFTLGIWISVYFLAFGPYLSIQAPVMMACHLLLIINNLLNFAFVNTLYLILDSYIHLIPGLFYEIRVSNSFGYVEYACVSILFCLIFSAFDLISPVQSPEPTKLEMERTY